MGRKAKTVAARATNSEHVDFNRVFTFVAVADAGSFTAAALKLGVPKSSASRAVSKLERELGVTLLQRTTRKLVVTDAGRAYLKRAREALTLLSEGHAVAREAVDEPSGTVRLTAPPDPLGELLAEPLARFAKAYPRIRLELLFTPRRVDLLEEEVDLAVRAGRLDDAALVGRRIASTPFVLVAAPSYLAERGTPRRVAQLAQHECLLYRAVGGAQRWTLAGRRGAESVLVRGAITVDDYPFVVPLARLGMGIAYVPSRLALADLAAGTLVRVLPRHQLETAALYVVYPANRRLPRRVALLRDHLVASLLAQMAPSPPG